MMDTMYINSKPHALLAADRTRPDGHRPPRRPPASDAGLDSGFAAVTSAHTASPSVSVSVTTSASTSAPLQQPASSSSLPSPPVLPAPYISSPAAAPPAASAATPSLSLAALHTPLSSAPPPPPSLRSTPAALPSSRLSKYNQPAGSSAGSTNTPNGISGNGNSNGNGNGNAGTTTGLPTSFPPLFFGPGNNTTTPATSLVGAHGKSIPLDDSTAAHRTSALRELNNNFPSPVFRHRYAKPSSAENSTYSQPVIVRTYSGPSPSASSSAHYRPPSSHRTNSRAAAARRIPLPPTPASVSASIRTVSSAAGGSSKHAPGSNAGGVKESLFGMARSKVKKGLLPWQWASRDADDRQQDDPKLPPMEAFSYKGFMADLQATTDIRADLDRIAEICARSHYSLSNQYDAHVAPHGSGAGFITSVTQRSQGRKKGGSGTGGPTLQAVPSDDDEASSRGHRRRRGGARSGRRQSAAYGTLETIMSSSRSSEEDKTKKKSAAEIAEGVRGRAVRKATDAAVATKSDTAKSGPKSASASGSKSPRGSRGSGKRTKDSAKPTSAERHSEGRSSPPPPDAPSTGSSGHSNSKRSRRRKPTSFAHAVMDSSKQHRSKSIKKDNDVTPMSPDALDTATTVALLSEPALPQTSNSQFQIPGSATPTGAQVAANGHHTGANGGDGHNSVGDIQASGNGSSNGDSPSAHAEDEDTAGFLSGLGNWLPWMGDSSGHQSYLHPKASSHTGSHQAEGSLRELLKNVDNGKPNKGKSVVGQDE